MPIVAETEQKVYAGKSIALVANQKINIVVDGIEDTDLSYTVPVGKKISITVVLSGKEETIKFNSIKMVL